MNEAQVWRLMMMSTVLYLDYCCFQRSFDDQAQTRIRLEALACEDIFAAAEKKRLALAWSFMHEDENALCPFFDRRIEVARLAGLCSTRIAPTEDIRRAALRIAKSHRLAAKDALHLACALDDAGIRVFVTCDDQIPKRTGGKIAGMVVVEPTEYVMMER